MNTLNKATLRAKKNYGIVTCLRAYKANEQGNGAATIAIEIMGKGFTTRQADAAINAGREIAKEFGISLAEIH